MNKSLNIKLTNKAIKKFTNDYSNFTHTEINLRKALINCNSSINSFTYIQLTDDLKRYTKYALLDTKRFYAKPCKLNAFGSPLDRIDYDNAKVYEFCDHMILMFNDKCFNVPSCILKNIKSLQHYYKLSVNDILTLHKTISKTLSSSSAMIGRYNFSKLTNILQLSSKQFRKNHYNMYINPYYGHINQYMASGIMYNILAINKMKNKATVKN